MAELTELQKQLFELQDIKYRDFHSKLMPETAKEKIIGIRTPVLRNFAKVFAGTPESEDFLQQLPHQFYEENNLHMMLITGIKDYPKCMEEVQRFLPYIDNWATCDFPEPKCFRKNKKAVLEEVRKWIASTETYTIRYGIGMLMRLFLDEDFSPDKNRDHDLSGDWAGHRECHILPDWLLVYRIEDDVLVLTLARTGTHSDLFGK